MHKIRSLGKLTTLPQTHYSDGYGIAAYGAYILVPAAPGFCRTIYVRGAASGSLAVVRSAAETLRIEKVALDRGPSLAFCYRRCPYIYGPYRICSLCPVGAGWGLC